MLYHAKNQSFTTTIAIAVALGCVIPSVGCATFSPGSKSTPAAKATDSKATVSKWKMPWSKKDEEPKPYPNPAKLAVTWTPDTFVQSGSTPTRGFGGRIFFYDEKIRPVPVEGELTVHAFAEKPDGSMGEVKRYHFTAEQFTKHFSQSDLGASYSIWIPWDAVGGEQTRISLVPSFRTEAGNLVQGETALVALPGRRLELEAVAKRPSPMDALLAKRDNSTNNLTTTTIPLGKRPIEAAPSGRPQLTAEEAQAMIARLQRPEVTPSTAVVAETPRIASTEVPSFELSPRQVQSITPSPMRFPTPPVNVMQTSAAH